MFYPEKCIGCGMCQSGCFSGARVLNGRDIESEQLMSELLADVHYYKNGGGVTFSGGEPLLQRTFLLEMIHLCKAHGIHTAIETSMIIYDEEIFSLVDLIMCDIKIFDRELHKKYTGVYNEQILKNIRTVDKLCKPMVVRTPVIPEINQGFDEIFSFIHTLQSVIKYELLPYHPLGESKCEALGDSPVHFSVPKREYMEELKEKYAYIRR